MLEPYETCEDNPRSPVYKPKRCTNHCVICEQGIYNGEIYLENYKREHVHYECILGLRWLIDWLGESAKIMEGDADEPY